MHHTASNDAMILAVSIAVGAILIRLRAGQVERRRIRAEIERNGGEALKIEPSRTDHRSIWSTAPPLYDVSFRTPQGEIVTATCRSGLGNGVEWTWSPPQSSALSGVAEIVEPTVCLACGATIAAGRVRCANCGWTYSG